MIAQDQGKLTSPPVVDIGQEIAKIRNTDPVLAGALDRIVDTMDAQSAWVKRVVQRETLDFKVRTPSGSLAARIGSWISGQLSYTGAWFRNLWVGPTEATATITVVDGVVSIDGTVVVGLPPSSLNVDYPMVSGLTLQNNTPGAGRITWSQFSVSYRGTTYTVVTGNTASSSETFAYWDLSSPTVLTPIAHGSYTPANNRFVMLVNDSGTAYTAYQQPTKNSISGIYLPDGAIVARHITAAQIDATKFNLKKIISVLTFTSNSPGAGSVAWASGYVYYNGTEYVIGSGNTALKFIYWVIGNSTLSASSTETDTLGSDRFLIATNTTGTYDEAWDKVAKNGVMRNNLAFGLLEGYSAQPFASATVIFPIVQADTTILSESAEGGLLYIYGIVKALPTGTTAVDLKINVDGAGEQTYNLVDTAGFMDSLKAISMQVIGNGTNIGDYFLILYGFTYRTSISVKMSTLDTNNTGQYGFKIFYVHKV